jgi:hypothetical protein
MITILSLIKQNHHNNKQQKRKELFEILQLILKYSETIPHCNYLNSFIKSALECFIFTKSKLTNNTIITIVNKNKLKNILTFISKRDCYGVEHMNKLIDLYYQI